PGEDLGPLAGLQKGGLAEFARAARCLEIAVRRRAARMYHALGNALMIEVGDLLAEDEILQQARAAHAALQRVLVVRDRDALVGGQGVRRRTRRLMEFAAGTGGRLAGRRLGSRLAV